MASSIGTSRLPLVQLRGRQGPSGPAPDRINTPQQCPQEPQRDADTGIECPSLITAETGSSKAKSHYRRRYPEHFCTFPKCCYKFSDEGALLAKDFEHLPVCHTYCWKLELERLQRIVVTVGCHPEHYHRQQFCHRQCYMRALLKSQDPEWKDREVVPRNRSVKELLRIPALEHMRERWHEKAN